VYYWNVYVLVHLLILRRAVLKYFLYPVHCPFCAFLYGEKSYEVIDSCIASFMFFMKQFCDWLWLWWKGKCKYTWFCSEVNLEISNRLWTIESPIEVGLVRICSWINSVHLKLGTFLVVGHCSDCLYVITVDLMLPTLWSVLGGKINV